MAEYIERQSVLAKKFNLESRLHEPIPIVLASEIERLPAVDVRPVPEGGIGEMSDGYHTLIDTTTAAVEIKRYCKQTGQMCELATDFGYCQLTACSKQKCGADMRETCNGDSCPMVQRWI